MKILICEGTLSSGGAERVVCNLSNYLVSNNSIKIISLMKTEMMYDINKNVQYSCIDKKVYRNSKFKFVNIINKIFKNIKRLINVKKIINEYNPDIILSFLPEPCFITLSLRKKNKIPIIISVRNDPKIEYQSKLYYTLMKKLYPRADGIIYQTEDAKKYFENILSCPNSIIPNPINPNFIIDTNIENRKKNIVSVGRLQEQKNHKMLITSFSNLSPKFNDYKLIIYGDGYLKESLLKQIDALGLNNRVFLPGNEKNIKEKIYDSSLFVLSSDYEGMPNALMEAMTLGLPVISTDCPCGGPKFLINNNENGILINVNDGKELTSSMEKVLSNIKFAAKLGKNAKKIQKDLAPDVVNKMWHDFIIKIYNESKK